MMSISIFQRTYDWIRDWRAPYWFKYVLSYIFENVLVPTIEQLGEEGYNELTGLIIKASKMDMSNKQKFVYVYEEFCKGYARKLPEELGESFINRSIELLYAELKHRGIV
jgi:hypothetical protein